jgi:hypothetical protein
VSSITVASDFAEQLQQVAEFADTIPEASMDRSEALRRSVFSFANITSSLRFRRMQRRGARENHATRLCNVKSSSGCVASATRLWPPYQPVPFLKLVLKQFNFGPVEVTSAS